MQQGRPSPRSDVPEPLPVDWVDLGSASLRYCHIGRGHGRPIVALHEMGGSIETWDLVLPQLAARHEVLAYDWRGFGYSERIRGEIALAEHVDDLARLLDVRNVGEPVLLSGCAVGAAIACGFAATYPERTAGLVLISPALEVSAEKRNARFEQIDRFQQNGMRAAVETSLAAGYPEQFRFDKARYETFRARWLANDPESFAANYRMLVGMEIDAILAAISCPTLLVSGQYDPMRTPEYILTVAARLGSARSVTVPGGHHMPHQVPDIISELMLDFADSLTAVEGA